MISKPFSTIQNEKVIYVFLMFKHITSKMEKKKIAFQRGIWVEF